MKRSTVERKLVMALNRLIVDEWSLLRLRIHGQRRAVSERAVAFQLGWYLRPLLDRMWDVDCEYNRSGSEENVDVKRAGGQARSTDLIVHRRGDIETAGNLLVLELKTNADVQSTEKGGSKESVRDVMATHHYQHGVFLDLGISHEGPETIISPEWIWMEAPAPSGDNFPAQERVYKQAADLEALIERGRKEARHRTFYITR